METSEANNARRVEATKSYYASIHPGPQSPIPPTFAQSVNELEKDLKMPVWLLVQDENGEEDYDELGEAVCKSIFDAREQMPEKGPVAVLVDSPGGYARSAYQIAQLFRGRCGEFTAVVPRYAKSAATLFVLGAHKILLNRFAELGPLDVQIFDPDREEYTSALDEVQTLERLHAFALEAFDQTMWLLLPRTRKKVETILPHALEFTATIMRPLLENVDVVHYTQRARLLKVAEEYAIRLLRSEYPKETAENIARTLVEKYPQHDFVIDAEELIRIGLRKTYMEPSAEQLHLMDAMMPHLGQKTMLGRIEEAQP
jgi:Serine dehydrogenase proteinase